MVGISVAVVLFGAGSMWSIDKAAADPVAATANQLDAAQAGIEAGAAHIHQLTLAYEQANLDVTNLGQQVRGDQAQIDQLQQRTATSQRALRKVALLSYIGNTGSDMTAAESRGDPSVGAEYLQMATGDVKDTVDRYHTQQRQLSSAEANLTQQQAAANHAEQATAGARQQALAQAAAEQGQVDRLQVQLDRYIELAAAQRAAAAAVATATTATVAPRPVSAPAPATQGVPVNNGLVAVVHTIVAAPTPAPPVPPTPPVRTSSPPPATGYTDAGGVWLQLRECESGDNYAENTGNGFFGAYQFSPSTWTDLGFPGRPDLESHQMQDQAAVELQSRAGWGQWPACSAVLGLR
jgi:hypothetical protein